MKELYVLTDGQEIAAHKYLTDQEAKRLNQEAQIATDGTWRWVLHRHLWQEELTSINNGPRITKIHRDKQDVYR